MYIIKILLLMYYISYYFGSFNKLIPNYVKLSLPFNNNFFISILNLI
jgi:hypothetical protein